MMRPVFVIGDIHGQYDKLVELLRDAALINADLIWSGGDSRLWFMGDFFDRGDDGISAVELVMRLQIEARDDGGEVGALLGNHEVLILAAHRFGENSDFRAAWEINGGNPNDLDRLTPPHLDWLLHLPAMTRLAGRLLIHADSLLYASYGRSIGETNEAFTEVLLHSDRAQWEDLLDAFSNRMAFISWRGGDAHNAVRMLDLFGGQQIIHGHTPIQNLRHKERPDSIDSPYIYNDALCINVDGGMYMGGPGFVYELPPLPRVA